MVIKRLRDVMIERLSTTNNTSHGETLLDTAIRLDSTRRVSVHIILALRDNFSEVSNEIGSFSFRFDT